MKKQMLLVTSLASALVLNGCSSEPVIEESGVQPAMVAPAANSATVKTAAPVQKTTTTVTEVNGEPVASTTVTEAKVVNTTYDAPKNEAPELIKITGIGYGAESTFEAYTPGQRRLMAIRSAKLDAYRSLAEQLYGIKIDSNTAVSTLTAKNDSFRARVNAIVRGARVVSITPMADRNYETILEVYVDQSFFRNAFVYTNNAQTQQNRSADDICHGLNCHSVSEMR